MPQRSSRFVSRLCCRLRLRASATSLYNCLPIDNLKLNAQFLYSLMWSFSVHGFVHCCYLVPGCKYFDERVYVSVFVSPLHISSHDNAMLCTSGFLQRAQCSHCKRCISYSNSVCPSVCPSVTRRYCVKTTARSTMQFSPLDSKMCLVL